MPVLIIGLCRKKCSVDINICKSDSVTGPVRPRGWVALLFHDRVTRRGWVVSSTPRPRFTPGKDPVPILQEAGWAPGPVWTGGKSLSPGIRFRTFQPIDSRYTDWATQPTINICTDVRPLKETDAFLRTKSKPQGVCLTRGMVTQTSRPIILHVVYARSQLIR